MFAVESGRDGSGHRPSYRTGVDMCNMGPRGTVAGLGGESCVLSGSSVCGVV